MTSAFHGKGTLGQFGDLDDERYIACACDVETTRGGRFGLLDGPVGEGFVV